MTFFVTNFLTDFTSYNMNNLIYLCDLILNNGFIILYSVILGLTSFIINYTTKLGKALNKGVRIITTTGTAIGVYDSMNNIAGLADKIVPKKDDAPNNSGDSSSGNDNISSENKNNDSNNNQTNFNENKK